MELPEEPPDTTRGVMVALSDLVEILELLDRLAQVFEEFRREPASLRAMHRRLLQYVPEPMRKDLDHPR